MFTEAVEVSTVGIGAGPDCDGQVLVSHDVLGLEQRILPKFVRRYADLFDLGVAALTGFAGDVRSGEFPGMADSYRLDDGAADTTGLHGAA